MFVIFDLDDTLYKERDFVRSAFRYIAQQLGASSAYDVMCRVFEEGGDAFAACNEYLNLDIPKETYLSWYRTHIPTLSLSNSTIQLLEKLSLGGATMGVLTDGRQKTQMNKIESLGLKRWIAEEDIVISEAFGSEKPSVRNYQYFMDRYGGCPSDYYYIADNPKKDFIAPNSLGWHTICLLDDGQNIHPQNFNLEKNFLPEKCIKDILNAL